MICTDRQALRRFVLERDEYQCQICDTSDDLLHVNHRIPVHESPELELESDNCETLCISCHAKFHELRNETAQAALIRSHGEADYFHNMRVGQFFRSVSPSKLKNVCEKYPTVSTRRDWFHRNKSRVMEISIADVPNIDSIAYADWVSRPKL